MDTSKHIFQLHGVDSAERPVLRRKLRRSQLLAFFAKLPPTVIGMEACGAAHYWARELRKVGPEARLMAPQHVKAYVKRNKNDGRGDEPADDAVRAGQVRRAADGADAGGGSRTADRKAPPALQRDPRLRGGVRPDRPKRSRQDRAAAGADRARQDGTCDGARAVGFAGYGLRAAANRDQGDRVQVDGLAPRQRHPPASGADLGGRADRT